MKSFTFRASEYAAHFRSILADLVDRKENNRKSNIFLFSELKTIYL